MSEPATFRRLAPCRFFQIPFLPLRLAPRSSLIFRQTDGSPAIRPDRRLNPTAPLSQSKYRSLNSLDELMSVPYTSSAAGDLRLCKRLSGNLLLPSLLPRPSRSDGGSPPSPSIGQTFPWRVRPSVLRVYLVHAAWCSFRCFVLYCALYHHTPICMLYPYTSMKLAPTLLDSGIFQSQTRIESNRSFNQWYHFFLFG